MDPDAFERNWVESGHNNHGISRLLAASILHHQPSDQLLAPTLVLRS
jgi:hypothetical protein